MSPTKSYKQRRSQGAPSPSVCFDSEDFASDSPNRSDGRLMRVSQRQTLQVLDDRRAAPHQKQRVNEGSDGRREDGVALVRAALPDRADDWVGSYTSKPTCMPRGFHYGGALGEGSYGCVVAATRTPDGAPVALKMFSNTSHIVQPSSSDPDWSTLRELRVLRLLPSCEFIVPPLEVVRCGPGDRTLCLVSEMMGESLESYIYYVYTQSYSPHSVATATSSSSGSGGDSGEPMSPNLLNTFNHCSIRWIAQLLCALQFLHDCGVGHRDVKCANILLPLGAGRALETAGSVHRLRVPKVKLCDFGLARPYVRQRDKTRESPRSRRRDTAPERLHRASDYGGYTQHVGTPVCLAPEVLCWSKYYSLAEADLWSLAADVIARLVSGPWPCGLFSEDYGGVGYIEGSKLDDIHDQDGWILRRIASVIGRPSDRELKAICRNLPYRRVLESQYFSDLPASSSDSADSGLRELYETCCPTGYSLLRSILRWDPADRATLPDAMANEFFYTMGDEEWPVCDWKAEELPYSKEFDYEAGDSWDSVALEAEMAWETVDALLSLVVLQPGIP
ncbi:Mitogen-activated protein kinase [Perkinsus olseni]|uniref:Mitogen-activated protein kinase n=1 Tax=Perkinsus olseni TaxID=32597 RepID=A0A7J6LTK2_PEROL|nr:Mitogen-activated protein kinase [Perkinsus olseni]